MVNSRNIGPLKSFVVITVSHLLGGVVAVLGEPVHDDDRPPARVEVAQAAGIVRQNVRLIYKSNVSIQFAGGLNPYN